MTSDDERTPRDLRHRRRNARASVKEAEPSTADENPREELEGGCELQIDGFTAILFLFAIVYMLLAVIYAHLHLVSGWSLFDGCSAEREMTREFAAFSRKWRRW